MVTTPSGDFGDKVFVIEGGDMAVVNHGLHKLEMLYCGPNI